MFEIAEELLQKLLTEFKGKLVDKSKQTSFHAFALPVYTNTNIVCDPRIQNTLQLDITEMYANYEKNFASMPGATFTTFIKWLAIKSMQDTPFNWRYINNKWFEFDNLPLEITRRLENAREVDIYRMLDVNHSRWAEFCQKHQDFKAGKLKEDIADKDRAPLHWLAYQMVGLHIPRMTSYNTSVRAQYSHQPWIVFSDRYTQEGKLYMPFYFSYSHATLTPADQEQFLKQFSAYGKMTPDEVETACKEKSESSKPLLTADPLTVTKSEEVKDKSVVPAFKRTRRSELERLQASNFHTPIRSDKLRKDKNKLGS